MYTCARNSSCENNIKQNGEENLLILEKSNETLTKKEEIVLEEDEVQTHEVFFKFNKSLLIFISQQKTKLSQNKPLNILKKIKHVSVAINKLRNRTQFRTLKFITDDQIEFLHDLSWFSNRLDKNKDHMNMLLAENPLRKQFYKIKIYIKTTFFFLMMHRFYSNF